MSSMNGISMQTEFDCSLIVWIFKNNIWIVSAIFDWCWEFEMSIKLANGNLLFSTIFMLTMLTNTLSGNLLWKQTTIKLENKFPSPLLPEVWTVFFFTVYRYVGYVLHVQKYWPKSEHSFSWIVCVCVWTHTHERISLVKRNNDTRRK